MTPNEKYNSGIVPHGGIFVKILRPIDPSNPNGGGTALGVYRLESCSPRTESKLVERPDIDDGPNGWFIINGNVKGNAVIQRNVAATPTAENGDYFDAALRVGADGAAVAERFVIHSPDHPADSGYRKMSTSVIVDQSATDLSPVNPQTGQDA